MLAYSSFMIRNPKSYKTSFVRSGIINSSYVPNFVSTVLEGNAPSYQASERN